MFAASKHLLIASAIAARSRRTITYSLGGGHDVHMYLLGVFAVLTLSACSRPACPPADSKRVLEDSPTVSSILKVRQYFASDCRPMKIQTLGQEMIFHAPQLVESGVTATR